jgi:trehalose 6-phosphate synthase/phosphatase
VLGIDSSPEAIEVEGRGIGLGSHPIGIDTALFRSVVKDDATAAALQELEHRFEGRTLLLGVERLDYTKGIMQKLRAFETYLEREPERARTTTLIQVLVPSRLDSPEYQAQRDEIERLIAGINGRFGQPGITPVEYFHRTISRSELVALYRRADVMLVTSLRDGMNLVAQEFAFCQAARGLPRRWNGTLLLSELAGAAQVLPGAVLINPWHVGGIADRLDEATGFDADERRRRLETMAARVEELDCRRWASLFLARLDARARQRRRAPVAKPLSAEARHKLARRFGRARRRTLLLDYDGTLRELAAHPELAAPTPEILDLLTSLAALPDTDVHLVSGRDQASLDRWFGHLPLWLCAEHGVVARGPGGTWRRLVDVDLTWLPRVDRLLRRAASEVPGTFVERKAFSVAWHYRQAEPEYGAWRANELLMSIEQMLAGVPAEILPGHRVVEVRARGVDKGVYVASVFPNGKERNHVVLAVGDDRTDQAMYAALPAGSVGIHVGASRPSGPVRHHYVLTQPADARALLRELAEEARAAAEAVEPAPEAV